MASISALGRKLFDLYPSVDDGRPEKRKEKRKHTWKGIALARSLRPEQQTAILGDDKYEHSN